jgi:competence protein ComEA
VNTVQNHSTDATAGAKVTGWPASAQAAAALVLLGIVVWLGVEAYRLDGFSGKAASAPRVPLDYAIDLNQADHAELLQLPGVGDSMARKIEAYRAEHGGFRDVADLQKIRGVGPVTMRRLTPWVSASATGNSGQQLPAASETARKEPSAREPRAPSKKIDSLTEPIDVNQASAAELQRLPGIGVKLASRIVSERRHAPFTSVDDLRRVPGIGPKLLERLRPYIKVSADQAAKRGDDAG